MVQNSVKCTPQSTFLQNIVRHQDLRAREEQALAIAKTSQAVDSSCLCVNYGSSAYELVIDLIHLCRS